MRSRGRSRTLCAVFWAMPAVVAWVLLLPATGASAAAEKQPPSPGAAGPNVRHPNLLLNRAEIDEIKGKIRAQPGRPACSSG